MSGVAVVWYLVAHNAGVLGKVAVEKIMAGELPLKTVLPAISVRQISSVPRLTVAMTESPVLHTDRVQVTPVVKFPDSSPSGLGYPGLRELLRLILLACPNTHGTVNGINVDSILPDIEGPDLTDLETGIISGSRDFIVKYSV